MNDLLLIAIGGAAGSVGRYLLATTIDARLATYWTAFPWGTLLVNVLGCALIGAVAVLSERAWVKPLVMVGILGGFTTFSSFGLQALLLLQQGQTAKALTYVGLSVVLCLGAVWLGQVLAQSLSVR